jgi:GNAT superfamily N-acetyltransferase
MDDRIRRACETFEAYGALGNEVSDLYVLRIVRNRARPHVWDANHATRVRADGAAEIARAFELAERAFDGYAHLDFRCDPFTPSEFEAELALRGYRARPTLQMLLEGPLAARAPAVEIRAATSERDWEAIARLTRLDHEEGATRLAQPLWDATVTQHMVDSRRDKLPAVRTWLAHADGRDCAFFSSFPGENGVGMVEDLFTHPDQRGRGVATALIAHAVADARERGASAVLIGANPDDTPKAIYARMGFRPLCLTRNYGLDLQPRPGR